MKMFQCWFNYQEGSKAQSNSITVYANDELDAKQKAFRQLKERKNILNPEFTLVQEKLPITY